jgi:hypothetical protein
MKPAIIGKIPKFKLHKSFKADWVNKVGPGEVDSITACIDEWSFPKLVKLAAAAGYVPHDAQIYASVNFLPVNGSIKWHTDTGSGINVACLAVLEDYSLGALPELITRHGAQELRQGDVFVFNADKGHAWISNDFSVLASITVRKQRQRRNHNTSPIKP